VDLLIEFAKKGLGISFVTKEFVAKELKEHSLFGVRWICGCLPQE
jgi:hypothetical protein